MARKKFVFSVPAYIVIENGKVVKIMLDANDWADWAIREYPDLTEEEAEYIEQKVKVPKMVEVDFQ